MPRSLRIGTESPDEKIDDARGIPKVNVIYREPTQELRAERGQRAMEVVIH
jgi:hypothetical protein